MIMIYTIIRRICLHHISILSSWSCNVRKIVLKNNLRKKVLMKKILIKKLKIKNVIKTFLEFFLLYINLANNNENLQKETREKY